MIFPFSKKQNTLNDNTARRYYFDYAASTPLDHEVFDAMLPFWGNFYQKDNQAGWGNAGAVHAEGVIAKRAVEKARESIAHTLNAHADEIVFTSGGTEANNLGVLGVIEALVEKGTPYSDIHAMTSTVEHPSILSCFRKLEKKGVAVSYISVDEEGFFNVEEIKKNIRNNTALVSLMYVNNEIGTIQRISKIVKIIKQGNTKNHSKSVFPNGLVFHTDASQAPLFLNCSVNRLGVDLLTVDAQKMYGPKGIGFLYKRRGIPLAPVLLGGNQENGLRPGTENTPLIVGLAKAFEIATRRREQDAKAVAHLRDYLLQQIQKHIPNAVLNGPQGEERIVNNINISLPGTESEFLILQLDAKGIAASSRSACLGHEDSMSYVVGALGKNEGISQSSLRLTLGRETKKADIDYLVTTLTTLVS